MNKSTAIAITITAMLLGVTSAYAGKNIPYVTASCSENQTTHTDAYARVAWDYLKGVNAIYVCPTGVTNTDSCDVFLASETYPNTSIITYNGKYANMGSFDTEVAFGDYDIHLADRRLNILYSKESISCTADQTPP